MAKVYVSSTVADLKQERQAVMDWLVTARHQPVHSYRPDSETVRESCLDDIDGCDLYVLLLGYRYGFQPEEGNPEKLSITHLEFRRAGEKSKPRIVLLRTSIPDIKLSDLEDPQRASLVLAFRSEVNDAVRPAVFSAPEGLILGLSTGVQNELDKLRAHTPDIPPGSPLAELIIPMTIEIKGCTRKVKSIANCKQIHDCLHEILQNVIRPLREEVLSVWEQEESLSEPRAWQIMRFVTKAAGIRGKLEGVGRNIEAEHSKLRGSVDNVLNKVQKWIDCIESLPDAHPWSSRGHFAEDLNKLASLVEFAFSEAEESMTVEESDLRDRFSELLGKLQQAREKSNLSVDDHKQFDDELAWVKFNREHVKIALSTHHKWQIFHNELQYLESFRETPPFESMLSLYREYKLPDLLALVDGELGLVHPCQAGSAENEQGAVVLQVVQQNPPPSLTGSPDECRAFADDLRRIKDSLIRLRQGDSAVALDDMRKSFEDAFFCVDKRTLEEVNCAEKRVVALDNWLDKLAQGRRKTD